MHRSSNASQEYLVSGWLRVTEAQVSDGQLHYGHYEAQEQDAETLLLFVKHLMFLTRNSASLSEFLLWGKRHKVGHGWISGCDSSYDAFGLTGPVH